MTVPVVVVVEVVAVPVVVVAVVVVLCFLGLAQALPYANVNGFQPANCAKWQEILVHVFNISKDCRRSSSPPLGLGLFPGKRSLCDDDKATYEFMRRQRRRRRWSFLEHYNIDL